MRILMMGTGPFAVPTLQGLLESRHDVLGLITRPVPPAKNQRRPGRSENPMRELAESRGLPVAAPENIRSNEAIACLKRYGAELYVVCDYGQILSADALATARLGGINLHASLLPKYRGAAPINWALWHGEAETGTTVIHMTAGLDAGPCLVQQVTPIDPDEDAEQLEARLATLGWPAVEQAIAMLEGWDGRAPIGQPQDPARATQAPRLQKSDGLIDWSRTARQIHNQVRALKPWPGSFTYWQRPKGNLRLTLAQANVLDQATDAPPGQVLQDASNRLVVACGQGCLQLLELQPAGKNRLPADAFLRGYPLAAGEQLGAASSENPPRPVR